MSKLLTRLCRHAIAFAALLLLIGGSAYAAAGQDGGGVKPKQLYACVTEEFHTLNQSNAGSRCPSGQRKISWNARGPRGVAGVTGRRGARGGTGDRGATGRTGATGAVGARGAVGAAGPKGDTGDAGATGPTGPAGAPGAAAVSNFAEFFALMPPDNATTVAAGTDVAFPQDGPTNGTIVRTSASTFVLPAAGTYRVAFSVPIQESGQLVLTINGTELAYTVTGRATGSSAIAGEALVQSVAGSVLTVRNPAGEASALTVQPMAGGSRPASATLTIEQLGS